MDAITPETVFSIHFKQWDEHNKLYSVYFPEQPGIPEQSNTIGLDVTNESDYHFTLWLDKYTLENLTIKDIPVQFIEIFVGFLKDMFE